MQIILASSSPYRRKVFAKLGFPFKVIPSDLDENRIKKTAKEPKELVVRLALEKARTVVGLLKKRGVKEFLVIGADSTAAKKEKGKWIFLDKPKNKQEAKKMALFLKGKRHKFYTGLAAINSEDEQRAAICTSDVYFKNFSDKVLEKFLKSGIWEGRAGGYDIKDDKSQLIEKYKGSYTNILGLPLEIVKEFLIDFGISL